MMFIYHVRVPIHNRNVQRCLALVLPWRVILVLALLHRNMVEWFDVDFEL